MERRSNISPEAGNLKPLLLGALAVYTVYKTVRMAYETYQDIKNAHLTSEPLNEPLDNAASERLLEAVEIHGDRYRREKLDTETLKHEGLGPKHMVSGSERTMYLSDVYDSGNRNTVVGYIKNDRGIFVARTYYLSKSQGMWRYLPSYDELSGWFSKGHHEDSLNLPIAAQKTLGILSQTEPKRVSNPKLVFYGTARSINTGGITYTQETDRVPQQLHGNFYGADEYKMTILAPETVSFDTRYQVEEPDFSKQITSWATFSPMYGELTMEAYSSKNDQYKYIFAKDAQQRAWIAAVENNSKVETTGVRAKWTAAGDLVMPLYEYDEQSGGYGSKSDRQGPYVQMWDNYLSNMPVIRQYYQSQGFAIPNPSVEQHRDGQIHERVIRLR